MIILVYYIITVQAVSLFSQIIENKAVDHHTFNAI